jgi:hypothetical protein
MLRLTPEFIGLHGFLPRFGGTTGWVSRCHPDPQPAYSLPRLSMNEYVEYTPRMCRVSL